MFLMKQQMCSKVIVYLLDISKMCNVNSKEREQKFKFFQFATEILSLPFKDILQQTETREQYI